jgi:bifunctional UDP-N-acetylglucosamine pyrophosphorylase / glucosamine-1-phosphate N-acetyltransferase
VIFGVFFDVARIRRMARGSRLMAGQDFAAIVLAAGKGTRMRSELPKVLHRAACRPLLGHVLDSLASLAPKQVVVVIGPDMEAVAALARPHPTAVQAERLGTAHAVGAARAALEGFSGTLLILAGDVPLVSPETLGRLLAARRATPEPGLVALAFRSTDPAYGRLVQESDGSLARIVEYKDATAAERAIELCNAGIYAVDARLLFGWLDRIRPDNAQREYYLTDIVGLARADGVRVALVEADATEVMGVNSRADLAAVEAQLQRRLRGAALAGGATLIDPETVYFAVDTVLGRDVLIEPNVVFGPGVVIGDGVTIKAFSHIEGAAIDTGAIIGPFARLRPGATIGPAAHIGNFVEIKNAVIEAGAKANHLSYVGDARVGARANIGAGTITCNYDGFGKYRTEIGADAFIGSNTALVAPVKVGVRAGIGAGSTITEDVPDDALAVARGAQTVRPDGERRRRAKRRTKEVAG